jgi:pteridine reductase
MKLTSEYLYFYENDWNTIINTNLTAPFFLSQSLSSTLSKNKGCIINIVDIHAQHSSA